MKPCIYLDHHATTPLDERVYRKMSPFFLQRFGNPASAHPYGWDAKAAINEAREQVARAINAHPTEIIFTSGATEATNMAIKGLFLPGGRARGLSVVTSAIEHGATLSTLEALGAVGVKVASLLPKKCGTIAVDDVRAALKPEPALLSLFFAHNEIGTLNDVQAIAKAAKEAGVLVHVDATQALGRTPIDCQALDVDMMSFSAHKIYGPKGVGFLYLRKGCANRLSPLIHGGGQEWGLRSGTLNVAGIVGLAEAARLATADLKQENYKIRHLRDRLLKNLTELDGVHQNGDLAKKVSANLSLSFEGIDGEALLLAICNKVAVSAGSACSCSAGQMSKVLGHLGLPPELAQATLRFGLGRFNTVQEIDEASGIIIAEIERQRKKTIKKRLVRLGK